MPAIAEGLVALAAPAIALLARGTVTGLESLAERVGADVAEGLGNVWNRLWRRLRENPEAVAAADRLAREPADREAASELSDGIANILRDEPTLAADVEALLDRARNVASGGAGSLNVVGDGNQVKQGRFNIDIGHAGNVTIGE